MGLCLLNGVFFSGFFFASDFFIRSSQAKENTPSLNQKLSSPDASIRVLAAVELALGEGVETGVQFLSSLIQDETGDQEGRAVFLKLLNDNLEVRKDLIKTFLRFAFDEDTNNQNYAINTLVKIPQKNNKEAKLFTLVLAKALLNPAYMVRENAALGLRGMKDIAQVSWIFPVIRRALHQPDVDIKKYALSGLARLGPFDQFTEFPEIMSELKAALQDEDPQVFATAVEALSHQSSPSGKFIPEITEIFLVLFKKADTQSIYPITEHFKFLLEHNFKSWHSPRTDL